jgi:hypothetical protein
MSMRHNQHIIRLALHPLPPTLLPQFTRVILLPQRRDQCVETLRYVRGRLAAGTAITPYIPIRVQTGGCALLAYSCRSFSFVVPVVPLADRLGDFNVRVGLAVEACVTVFVRVVPGVPVAAAEVEELEGALGAGAGGDVAIVFTASVIIPFHISCFGIGMGNGSMGTLHVCEVLGDDQSIGADEGFAGRAHALFAVGCKRDVGGAGVAAVKGPFCFAVADYEDAGGGHVGAWV